MTKFRVGDKIRRISVPCKWAPIGYETVVLENNYYMGKGGNSPTKIHERMWKLVKESTHFPLYSEEAAVKLLEERGYTITPPPEPLKGKIYVLVLRDGTITSVLSSLYDKWSDRIKANKEIIAIVDWVEGQGI